MVERLDHENSEDTSPGFGGKKMVESLDQSHGRGWYPRTPGIS